MAETIRELLVDLGIDADTQAVAAFDKAIDSVSNTMREAARITAWVAAGVTAVTVAVAKQAYDIAQVSDEYDLMAVSIGTTVEATQELRYAFGQLRLEEELVTRAFIALNGNVQEARDGSEEIIKKFKKLGLSVKELKTLKPEEIFYRVAEGISKLPNHIQQSALASDLFGAKLGAKLLPALKKGTQGFKQFSNEAREYGLILTRDQIDRAKELENELDRFHAIFGGLKKEIGLSFMPVFTELLTEFDNFLASNREIIKEDLKYYVKQLGDGLKWVAKNLKEVKETLDEIPHGWDLAFTAAMGAVLAVIGTGLLPLIGSAITSISAIITLITKLSVVLGVGFAPTIGVVIAVVAGLIAQIAAIYLLLGDFIGFLQGKQSATGKFFEALEIDPSIRDTFLEFFSAAYDAVASLLKIFWQLTGVATSVFMPVLKGIAKLIGVELWAALKKLAPVAKDVFVGMTAALRIFADMLAWVANKIEQINDGISGAVGGFVKSVVDIMGGNTEQEVAARARQQGAISGAGGQSVDSRVLTTSQNKSIVMQGDSLVFTNVSASKQDIEGIIKDRETRKTLHIKNILAGSEK